MYSGHQIPLFRLLIPLIAGILFADSICLLIELKYLAGIFSMVLICLLYLHLQFNSFRHYHFGTMVCLCFFIGGMILYNKTLPRFQFLHFSNHIESKNLVLKLSQCKEGANSTHCVANAILLQDKKRHWSNSSGKLKVYLKSNKFSIPELNERVIKINSYWQEIPNSKNPAAFSFKNYLKRKSIFHQTFLKPSDLEFIPSSKEKNTLQYFNDMQGVLATIIKNTLTKKSHQEIATALTLGYKEELDSEIKTLFADTGAMHILAVSGLHVGMIAMLMMAFIKFISRFIKIPEMICLLLVLSSIWAFSLLTGATASVIRAATMISPVLLARQLGFKHKINSINALSLAGFILLFENPNALFHLSFQFSFTAVLGILLNYNIINKIWTPPNVFLKYAWDLTCVSLSAQIALFPLTIYYFHQFPVYFLLSNFVAIPSAFLILFFTIGLLLSVLLLPFLTNFIQIILEKSLDILLIGLNGINDLPFGLLDSLWLSRFDLFLWYCIIGFLCCFLFFKQNRFLFISLTLMFISSYCLTYKKIVQHKQTKMIVYHHKRGFEIDFIIGSTCYVWSSQIGHAYASKNYLLSIGATKQIKLNDSSNFPFIEKYKGPDVVFCGKRIRLLDTNVKITTLRQPSIAFVLLHNNPNIELIDITKAYPNAKIIALASNFKKSRISWKEEAKRIGSKFYDCEEEGAFITDLN